MNLDLDFNWDEIRKKIDPKRIFEILENNGAVFEELAPDSPPVDSIIVIDEETGEEFKLTKDFNMFDDSCDFYYNKNMEYSYLGNFTPCDNMMESLFNSAYKSYINTFKFVYNISIRDVWFGGGGKSNLNTVFDFCNYCDFEAGTCSSVNLEQYAVAQEGTQVMKPSKFQFRRPTVVEVIYKTNENFKPDSNKDISIAYRAKYKKSDDCRAQVTVTLNIGEESDQVPFFISITMEAVFKWDESMEATEVKSLLNMNGPALIIGYARPIISMLTINTKYPPLDLPFLNLSEDVEVDVEEETAESATTDDDEVQFIKEY